MLVGKTFSFTPNEANVDYLMKAYELQQNLFCLVRILTLCHILKLWCGLLGIAVECTFYL